MEGLELRLPKTMQTVGCPLPRCHDEELTRAGPGELNAIVGGQNIFDSVDGIFRKCIKDCVQDGPLKIST